MTKRTLDNIIVKVVMLSWLGSIGFMLWSSRISSDWFIKIGMCGVAALVVMCILMGISKLIFLVIKQMKKLLLLPFVALFALGCTETIEVEKLVRDTVFVDKPRAASFVTIRDTVRQVITDTVEIEVIIRDTVIQNTYTTDTVYHVITKDSIIYKEVEKLVTVYDTVTQVVNNFDTIYVYVTDTVEIQTVVYDRSVVYRDTLYMPGYVRPTWDVPLDLMPHLEEFAALAYERGIIVDFGMLIVHYTDDLPGEGWISSSFKMGDNDQRVIFLDERLPAELHRASILRELGRLSLNKKYSNDPNKIMNPLWRYDREITQQDLDNLFL